MPLRNRSKKSADVEPQPESEAAEVRSSEPQAEVRSSEPQAEVVEPPEVPEVRPEVGSVYYAVTMNAEECGRQLRLDDDLAAAKAVLADLEAERGAADADLERLEQDAEFRARRREELEAQRDARAVAADVEGTANAEAILMALARVDGAQSSIAAKKREDRTELDRKIAAAAEAVEEAQRAVTAFEEANLGRVPQLLVDWVLHRQIRHMLEHAPAEIDDGVKLAEAIRMAPDLVAASVAADPAAHARTMREAMAPKPKRRPSREEARRMVDEGMEALRQYEVAERGRWQAIAAAPIGTTAGA